MRRNESYGNTNYNYGYNNGGSNHRNDNSQDRNYDNNGNRGDSSYENRGGYRGNNEYVGNENGYDRQGPYDSGSENYPSSYSAIPIPGGQAKNCSGSGCCVPKCFAEKGSRVSVGKYNKD